MQESDSGRRTMMPVEAGEYAGFRRRFLAACIDMAVYMPFYLALRAGFDWAFLHAGGTLPASGSDDGAIQALRPSEVHRWWFESLFGVLALASYGWFFSSRWQGSPGMRVLAFRVTDTFGRRIGFMRALAWGVTGTFTWLLCCAGVLYMQKDILATHDMLLSCQEQHIDVNDCVPEIEKIIGMPFSSFEHLMYTAAGLTLFLFLIWALSIALPRDKTGFHNLICGTRFLNGRA